MRFGNQCCMHCYAELAIVLRGVRLFARFMQDEVFVDVCRLNNRANTKEQQTRKRAHTQP